MEAAKMDQTATLQRPKRADARRNYEKLIAAGREAFAEGGSAASLEEVARRADVGIGTLYRHFPTRQALLEAIYLEEVEALGRSAEELADQPPWEALDAWLHGFVAYVATKHALMDQLVEYLDRDAEFFKSSRGTLYAAGEPLLERAQKAGVVRSDVNIEDLVHLVAGIAKMPREPDQIEHVLGVALDGLRVRAPGS
jgi:AcrR family transcriptional regulator